MSAPEEASADAPVRVSVIIPCFNAERYLREALDSVMAQQLPALEVIAVDDGSTDQTATVARSYPGVTLIQQENQGVSAARNTGVAAAKGEILCFLDADDRLLPGSITERLELLDREGTAGVYCDAYFIDLDGKRIGPMGLRSPGPNTLRALCAGNLCPPSMLLLRRQVYSDGGGLDPSIRWGEEYDLWLRIAARGAQFAKLDRHLVEYRINPEGATRAYVDMFLSANRVFSRRVLKPGLWTRYPVQSLLGWAKLRHYFAAGHAGRHRLSQAERARARNVVLKSPSLWPFLLFRPLLGSVKRWVRLRRAGEV
ncbi:MAG TPA: glycosyltransferase [Fimbriimonadaceae bacterium]|nr:glycosyltransferase [Fimbriimonadaceae bacterium]